MYVAWAKRSSKRKQKNYFVYALFMGEAPTPKSRDGQQTVAKTDAVAGTIGGMKVATSAQMRAIDRRAMDEMGVPGPVLMEAAGIAFARVCVEELGGSAKDKRVLMVCGRGNNGGDGYVAARHLSGAGARVTVVLAADPSEIKGDALVHFAPLRWSGVRLVGQGSPEFERIAQEPWDLVGDALLGTGARGPLSGVIGLLVAHIAELGEKGIPVVSADIPSGVDADTGTLIDFVAATARRTVTFALPKPGLLLYPGAVHAGKVTVAPIGLPPTLLSDNPALHYELTTSDWMRTTLPQRTQARDANKGAFGTVLVIAGSSGMAGAAVLSALSALRSGAGLVILAVPQSLLDTAAALAPEAVLKTLPETSDKTHGGTGAIDAALALADRADAIAIGPGMGGNPQVAAFVQPFVRRVGKPVVIDADGLNALTSSLTSVRYRGTIPTVLTPHPGEMGRLLGMETRDVQADRQAAVLRCASAFKAVALLKGARTLIAAPDGRMAFNRGGTPALATAGSGDVLTGAIAALLASKLPAYEAARAGAYLHALAGEIAAEELGTAGVVAGDVRDRLPRARQLLYEKADVNDL
jgi:NAD(P)H-hydrate epimerase